MTSPSHCPPRTRTAITGSKGRHPCVASDAHPAESVSIAQTVPSVPSAPRRFERDEVTQNLTRDGLIRWVVFQRTARGRFRLTQYLFAPDKRTASDTARAWYEGCAGTLELMSYAEYEAVLDDLSALERTRVAPKEPGQRRPHMKRGISYGCCVWCGAVTSSRGGKPPKYCASHRDRAHQRAYRTGAVVGSIPRAVAVVVSAPRRQVVGA